MVNKVLVLTGVILFGVVATIIAINYCYHPTRPFYPPPATSPPPSVTANTRQGHEHTS